MGRGPEQRTPWENRGLEEHAARVIHEFITNSLVMLFATGADGRVTNQGSGTLVRGASGAAIILTAKHVVEGEPTMHMFTSTAEIHDAIGAVHAMPGTDLALVELKRRSEDVDTLAIDSALLSDANTATVVKGDTVVAAGFPKHVARTVYDHVRGRSYEHYGFMIYRTCVAGVDRKAASLIWTEGEMSGDPHVYEQAGIPRVGMVNHKIPKGISGGPVWKQQRTESLIWTVAATFRVVGVLFAFTSRRMLATPASRWSQWVREELATL